MTDIQDLGAPPSDPPSILSKAFDLLRSFNGDERVMTLSELSRASGLPKSTVHRLIARLTELGAIENHRSGYKLGVSLLELAGKTPAGSMRDKAMPYLAALHRWSGQTVHLAVLRDHEVVYLEKLAIPAAATTMPWVGARLPAHCTAIGKALLAWENPEHLRESLPSPLPTMTVHSKTNVDDLLIELRKVRTEGIAYEHSEAQLGQDCVAVPIVIHGYAIGAISIAHPNNIDGGQKFVNALLDTAARIAKASRESLAKGRSHWFPHEI